MYWLLLFLLQNKKLIEFHAHIQTDTGAVDEGVDSIYSI